MALSGIQIYKLLPQTNCKECGFPTCLAFAMKLAAKQVELDLCPYVEAEAKAQLAESAAPPMRLVTLKANGNEVAVGNETVLFRHEKRFVNLPGLFVRVKAGTAAGDISTLAGEIEKYTVDYVGMELGLDGFAVEANGDSAAFVGAIEAVRSASHKPLVLISTDPAIMAEGLRAVDGEAPLIYGANADNWEAMADLAKQHKAPLAIIASTIGELADLTEKVKGAGVDDLVLDPSPPDMTSALALNTQIWRLALKQNERSLGYPVIAFPGNASDVATETVLATQAIAKYAGFVVLDTFAPELAYPLLVLRQNIYTDPQKPIQVQPGIYEINDPGPEDPVLVTTNFSITYFSVANEVDGSGLPAWLLVADAEGMSVLTAWAAGKFDAERIAKGVKEYDVASKVTNKTIVLPGHVAVLSGELEEELPDWTVRVGPREAVDIPGFMKDVL